MPFFKELTGILTLYTKNRNRALTENSIRTAEFVEKCKKDFIRRELAAELANQCFEERAHIRSIVSTALDLALKNGDTEIAKLALTMFENEYSKDILGDINKAYGGLL